MTYNAAEVEPIDIIRGRLLDTSNDPATEYLPDATYLVILARHPSWLLAGAEIAGRIYRMIAARPVAVASDGDSIRWSEARAAAIKDEQAAFLAEYAAIQEAEAYGGVITVTGHYLTGDRTAVAEWS